VSDMNDMSEHEGPGQATTPAFLLKRYTFEVKRLTFSFSRHHPLPPPCNSPAAPFLLKRYTFEFKRLKFRVVPRSPLAPANYSQL
jgi:hypothetical protein